LEGRFVSLGEILHHPVSRWLVLGNLALTALIVLRLAYPAATLSALHFGQAPEIHATTPGPDKSIQVAGAESYAMIVDRPLFIETRRMPKDEPSPSVAASNEIAVPLGPADAFDGLTLSGIVMSGGVRVALLKSAGGQNSPSLKEGDEFHGWHVEKIEAQAVVFTGQGEERKRIAFPEAKPGVSVGTP
jgi:hypothetical protein